MKTPLLDPIRSLRHPVFATGIAARKFHIYNPMNQPTPSVNPPPRALRRGASLTQKMNSLPLPRIVLPILAALTLLNGQAGAAIALQDGSTAMTHAAGASASMTVGVTSGAGVLVVIVEDHNAYDAEPATLSWNGATLNMAVQSDPNATTYRGVAIYCLFNPPTGSATLSVTVPGADNVWVTAYTLSGVGASIAPLTFGTNSVGTAVTGLTNNVAGVAGGSWAAVGASYASTNATIAITGTGGTPALSTDTVDGISSMTSGYLSGLSAGTVTFVDTPTSTNGAQKMILAGAVFSPAVPGAVWTGSTSTNWDTTTANWTITPPGAASGSAGDYADGYGVGFGDTDVSQYSVNLASPVAPASVMFSNSLHDYTISGAGAIGGVGALTLSGTGTVTLNISNTFTGAVTVGAGATLNLNGPNTYAGTTTIGTGATLAIGGGGNLGNGTYAAAISDNGTLNFNSTTAQILTGSISGTGGVTVSGGTLTLGNDSLADEAYTGPTMVANGSLILNFPNAGTGGIYMSSGLTINNGGTVAAMQSSALEGYTAATPYLPVTINAGGTLTTTNTTNYGGHLYGVLNLNGGTLAMSGTASTLYAGWEINNQINVNGGTATSTLSAQQMGPQQSGGTVFNITSGGVSQTTPGVDLIVTGTFTNCSDAADTGIILTGNGVMALAGGSNDIVHGITIGSGTTLLLTNAATIYSPGLITNNGNLIDGSAGAQTLSGVISGTGAVQVAASGAALTLNAADTYSGNTVISAGTLLLGAAGSIINSPNISISAGAAFNVSALSSYTLGANASLTASGTATPASVKGIVSFGSSPVTLNYDGSHPALTISSGTLTLNSNAFTVNGSPLPPGNYTLVQQTTGSITDLSGTYPAPTGTAIVLGSAATISVSGGNVVLNIASIKTYPLITWATPTPIPYGTALGAGQLDASANIEGGYTYTPPAGTVLNAGTTTLSVLFTPMDTTDYSTATQTVSLLVSNAPLSVSANNTNRVFGQTNPVFTGTLTGIVNGDNITAAYTCAATASSPVGTYPIVPVFNDPNGRLVNYAVTTNDGTLTVTTTNTTAPQAPANLLVDDVVNPVGTEAAPYFGWLDNDTNANEVQTGYEVLVASSAANLNANDGDLWDSGAVASDRENHVVYAGAPLTADTQYFWKVRTWNALGIPGPYSTNGAFTVGLLANSDWSGAYWIEGSTSGDVYTYYRKWTPTLPATTVQRATVYITSVHKYALYVNGTLVGKGPAYAFPAYQFYNAFDITSLVTPGSSNLFAIFNHYFGGGSGRVASSPGVLMKAVIHFSDGTSTNIVSDATSWLQSTATNWATGQGSRNGEGAGYIEKIYAGSLTTNWFTTSFTPSGWSSPTSLGTHPNSTWTGTLLPDLTRIVETVLTPVSVTMNQSGTAYVVDMGKVYSGMPLISFSGTATGTIGMCGGFALLSSGDIDSSQNQSTTLTYFAVLNGSPFTYEPAEYDTMRYFVISNSPMPVTTNNFAFVERNSQMNAASSSFASSSAMLNAVWGLMKQTTPVDAQEEFIDSMRQKGGFLGDGFQESITAMWAWDERPLTRRRLNEFIESMAEFWSTPAVNVGRVNACYPDDSNARDIPDYTQAFLQWVWEYYMQTGDLAFLGTNYTQLTNIAQYVNRSVNPANGLITKLLGGTSSSYTNGIIDWPPDMQFGYDLTTVTGPGNAATVINGWAWEDYDIVSRIAGALGNTTDSNTYRALATNLQAAINTNLINSSGLYVDGLVPSGAQSGHASQHANAFPLSLNIVPAANQAAVTSLVISDNMSVSALGIIQLERALGEANQGPALLNLYTNTNNYGWARILALNGSATWESWTANTDGNSESHGWGDVGLDGYVRYILGIKPLTAQCGRVQILPLDFTNILPSASGMLTTDRGPISVEWDRSPGLYHLAFTIPVNVTATAYVPQGGIAGAALIVDGTNATATLITNLGVTANGYVGLPGFGSGAHNIQHILGPISPSSLTATPGNTQNILNWSPSLNATNYVIERGTSSGNENFILASGVTGTNYTDTGLTNGDTYYYVVIANCTLGTSVPSPEAAATPILGVAGAYWSNTVTASAQSWNVNANWNSAAAFPNASQAVAVINNGIAANQTIALGQSIAVGSLYLGAPGGSYNITPNGGTLTMNNSPAPGFLTELATSRGDTISAPIINNGILAIANLSANTFALSGGISGSALETTLSGNIALSGANTYSGITAVNSGLLSVNNISGSATSSGIVSVNNGAALTGAGAIAGAVTVQSGGTLIPGNPMGALAFGSSLTLAAGSTAVLAVSQSPLTNASATVVGALANGGTLIITNAGAGSLQGGATFKLFTAGSYIGQFSNVELPSLQPGLAWNTNRLNTAGLVSVASTIAQPLLLPLSASSGGLVFSGTGGVSGGAYYLLRATNLPTPLSNWTPVLTNYFDSSGDFNFTNPPAPSLRRQFYMIEEP